MPEVTSRGFTAILTMLCNNNVINKRTERIKIWLPSVHQHLSRTFDLFEFLNGTKCCSLEATNGQLNGIMEKKEAFEKICALVKSGCTSRLEAFHLQYDGDFVRPLHYDPCWAEEHTLNILMECN